MLFPYFTLLLTTGLAAVQCFSLRDARIPYKRTLQRHEQTREEKGLGIWDGTNTTIKQNPWVVGVFSNGSFVGQGCIIATRWVLSSGDNFYELPAYYFYIVAASNNGLTGQKHEIQSVHAHPDYDVFTFQCDFAVAKIKGEFVWSDSVKPVKLPTHRPKINSWLTVAGWGSTGKDKHDQNTVFKQGELMWISKTICPNLVLFIDFDFSVGCAEHPKGTTLCNGDWGDVFVQNGSVYGIFVAGVKGGFCSKDAGVTVLADVFGVVDWINQTIHEF